MSIVDKAKGLYDSHKDQIQDGINKGKDLINKAMGGRHSAQTTAPDAEESGADAGVSSPGAASSGAGSAGAASSGAGSAGASSAGAASSGAGSAGATTPGAASAGGDSSEVGTEPPAAPPTEA